MAARSRLMPGGAFGCVLAVSACGGPGSVRRTACLPSPLHVRPAQVKAGGTATVSSPRFACRCSYPAGHRYTLVLGQVGRGAPLSLGMFPVSRDGAFMAVVHIPRRASPGQSYVDVTGSPFDQCEDTDGVATSCAGYSAPLRILAQG